MRAWYQTLLRLRRDLFGGTGEPVSVVGLDDATQVLTVDRPGGDGRVRCLYQFGSVEAAVDVGPGWTGVLFGPGARLDGETVRLEGWTCAVLTA